MHNIRAWCIQVRDAKLPTSHLRPPSPGFAARRPLALGLPLGKVRAALGAEWRPRTVEEAMRAWAEHEAPCDKPLGQ